MDFQFKSQLCSYCNKKYLSIITENDINGCWLYKTLMKKLNKICSPEKEQELKDKLDLLKNQWF